MKPLSAREIQRRFLSFFEKNEHLIIPSASLIPDAADKSTLFTSSGMHPLKKLFTGEEKPPAPRLTDSQKSFRTGDLENIGDTYHNTFFFMLGNWSIGDYWKKEAIGFAWEFLTKELGLPPEKLYPTYFKSDLPGVPTDEESRDAWLQFLPAEHVVGLGAEDNFWAAGPTGPCGPCTEIYFDLGADAEGWCGECSGPGCEKCGRFLEIWNAAVCMEFDRQEDGELRPLPFKSIDAGAGLERIAAVMQGGESIYETDLFENIRGAILHRDNSQPSLKNEKYSKGFAEFGIAPFDTTRAVRIVADHLRAAVFLIADGVRPSNTEQGYVLRRLIRRVIREKRKLNGRGSFLRDIALTIISQYGAPNQKDSVSGEIWKEPWWPEIGEKRKEILSVLTEEEIAFENALEKGEREFAKLLEKIRGGEYPDRNFLTGAEAFNLFETFGLPVEMIDEMSQEVGFAPVPRKDFDDALAAHREKSRTSAVGRFKGGLAEGGDAVKKTAYHTAAHLLLAALQKVLGAGVEQKGANITDERLRFDFSAEEKLTDEQRAEVEKLVNEALAAALPVSCEEMPTSAAKERGAHGSFWERYGDEVKVFTIGAPGEHFSMEICGGPHVENTAEIPAAFGGGKFRIKKEESSSKGVRRVKAVID